MLDKQVKCTIEGMAKHRRATSAPTLSVRTVEKL